MPRLGFEHPQESSIWTSLGLLVLRVAAGGQLVVQHGLRWWRGFDDHREQFSDPWDLGPTVSMAVAAALAVACGSLVAAGLLTRVVCVPLILGTGWLWQSSGMEGISGEAAGLYCACFSMIALAGAGRFSADAVVFRRG